MLNHISAGLGEIVSKGQSTYISVLVYLFIYVKIVQARKLSVVMFFYNRDRFGYSQLLQLSCQMKFLVDSLGHMAKIYPPPI